jgi:hypothetical protein
MCVARNERTYATASITRAAPLCDTESAAFLDEKQDACDYDGSALLRGGGMRVASQRAASSRSQPSVLHLETGSRSAGARTAAATTSSTAIAALLGRLVSAPRPAVKEGKAPLAAAAPVAAMVASSDSPS